MLIGYIEVLDDLEITLPTLSDSVDSFDSFGMILHHV